MKRSQIETPPQYYYKNDINISGPDLIKIFKDIIKRDKIVRFRVGGSSMFPSIRNGDIIYISPLGEKSPVPGDVVAFVHPPANRLLVHRIIRKNSQMFVMKGDNNRKCDDGAIPLRNILGQMTGLERNGKRMRLGLGPERFLIAWMSRIGGLRLIKRMARPIHRLFNRQRS